MTSTELNFLQVMFEKNWLPLSLLERDITLEYLFILLSSMLSMILTLDMSREYLVLFDRSCSASYRFLSTSRSSRYRECFFSLKVETQRK